MTKKSRIPASRKQKLAKVTQQMDQWMHDRTRLILSISTPLFQFFLRGRVVGRLERLFVFDAYGETCRVPVIPEYYDHVLRKQKDPISDLPSVTFEKSGMQGKLEIAEDGREAGLAEMCADWMLSNTALDTTSSDSVEQVSQ